MNKYIKLFSEILGFEVSDITYSDCESTELVVNRLDDTKEEFYINVYELAHKCKEFGIEKGFIIETSYEGEQIHFGAYCICRVFFDGDKIYDNYSECEDYQKETEAIFKATQWIIENKEGVINMNNYKQGEII